MKRPLPSNRAGACEVEDGEGVFDVDVDAETGRIVLVNIDCREIGRPNREDDDDDDRATGARGRRAPARAPTSGRGAGRASGALCALDARARAEAVQSISGRKRALRSTISPATMNRPSPR